jgi:hypothetical protein
MGPVGKGLVVGRTQNSGSAGKALACGGVCVCANLVLELWVLDERQLCVRVCVGGVFLLQQAPASGVLIVVGGVLVAASTC